MAGQPYVGQVGDAAAQSALRAVFDRLATLEARVAALEATPDGLNAGGGRVTNVATPVAGSDAATLDYVRQYVQTQIAVF